MKVAELFTALGFKVQGQEKVDRVDRTVHNLWQKLTKLTVAVNAVNFALVAMMDTSARAAQGLRNFALSTGLSTDELQQWQHLAQMSGIAAEDMLAAVKTLQSVRTDFALGNPKNVGVWSLLGVDPRGDPFEVLRNLRSKVSQINDVGIARNLLGQVGLEGLLPVLRSTNEEFEKWSKNFIINQRQIAQLAKFNAAWQSLKASIISVKTQFAAALAPALTIVARGLEKVALLLATFTQWLDRGGALAGFVKVGLATLAIALLGIGAILAVILGLVSAISVFLLAAELLPLLLALAPILFYLTAIAAVIGGLIMLIEDIWVSISGGDGQLAAIGKWLAGFKAIEVVIQAIWTAWDKFMDSLKIGQRAFEWIFSHMPDWALGVGKASEPGAKATNQTVNVKIDGAQSPRETGREVVRSMKELNRAALDQAPVPNY